VSARAGSESMTWERCNSSYQQVMNFNGKMQMNELKNKTCVTCSEGSSPISDSDIKKLLGNIPEWEVSKENGINRLQRVFTFPDFKKALAFTNHVGELAELEQHHPKLITEWGKVTVIWWTHSVKGLHMNDFIMASRTSELNVD